MARDTLQAMLSTGSIGPNHIRAAQTIERMLTRCQPGILAVGRRERIDHARAGGAEALVRFYRDVYQPWRDHLPEPVYEVVVAIIQDGRTATQVDRDKHWRNGTAARWLAHGLDSFARIQHRYDEDAA